MVDEERHPPRAQERKAIPDTLHRIREVIEGLEAGDDIEPLTGKKRRREKTMAYPRSHGCMRRLYGMETGLNTLHRGAAQRLGLEEHKTIATADIEVRQGGRLPTQASKSAPEVPTVRSPNGALLLRIGVPARTIQRCETQRINNGFWVHEATTPTSEHAFVQTVGGTPCGKDLRIEILRRKIPRVQLSRKVIRTAENADSVWHGITREPCTLPQCVCRWMEP